MNKRKIDVKLYFCSNCCNLRIVHMKKYKCTICGFIYDPYEGDPDGGISPGTPFEEIPDTWVCPVCGVSKADFEPVE